jgi:hypothetical protein
MLLLVHQFQAARTDVEETKKSTAADQSATPWHCRPSGSWIFPKKCETIFFYFMRPDCRMSESIDGPNHNYHKGCTNIHDCIHTGLSQTKILVLSRQIYHEAVGFLHAFENIIRIVGKGHKVFRHPQAFGKPGFFACSMWISHFYLGPIFTEL